MRNITLLLFSSLTLLACTTVDDFRKMTPHQRAEKVCLRQKNIENIMQQKSSLNAAIADSQLALSSGYRVHKQCYEVEVPGDTKTECKDWYGKLQCTTSTKRKYRTQCDEKPVSISPELERSNIQSWSLNLRNVESNLQTTWSNCYTGMINLTPEEAYKYF